MGFHQTGGEALGRRANPSSGLHSLSGIIRDPCLAKESIQPRRADGGESFRQAVLLLQADARVFFIM